MPRKVILIADPGIDTAFAVALALNDPGLEVVGLLPTAGNVSAEQATANVQILIEQEHAGDQRIEKFGAFHMRGPHLKFSSQAERPPAASLPRVLLVLG